METFDYEQKKGNNLLQLKYLYKNNWELKGWEFYKNNTFIAFIPYYIQFSILGVNTIVKSDKEAIKAGLLLTR